MTQQPGEQAPQCPARRTLRGVVLVAILLVGLGACCVLPSAAEAHAAIQGHAYIETGCGPEPPERGWAPLDGVVTVQRTRKHKYKVVRRVRVAEDGAYIARLRPGRYIVSASTRDGFFSSQARHVRLRQHEFPTVDFYVPNGCLAPGARTAARPSGIRGLVEVTCRPYKQRNCPERNDYPGDRKPYDEAELRVRRLRDNKFMGRVFSGPRGHYRIKLPPGGYRVIPWWDVGTPIFKDPDPRVRVRKGRFTRLHIVYSGIRK
jgi:hypothetical protein